MTKYAESGKKILRNGFVEYDDSNWKRTTDHAETNGRATKKPNKNDSGRDFAADDVPIT